MNISTFHSGQAPTPPASPSARALLRKRIQAKTEAAGLPTAQKRTFEVADLQSDEVLSDSDTENTPPKKEHFNTHINTMVIPVPNGDYGNFDSTAECYYIKKVIGERGLVDFANYQEAMNSDEMVQNRIDKIVAECLWGRDSADPDLKIEREARVNSGYSNRIQTFTPLMTRFKEALTELEFDELKQLLAKSKKDELSAHEKDRIAQFYEKVPPVEGGDFSWDI